MLQNYSIDHSGSPSPWATPAPVPVPDGAKPSRRVAPLPKKLLLLLPVLLLAAAPLRAQVTQQDTAAHLFEADSLSLAAETPVKTRKTLPVTKHLIGVRGTVARSGVHFTPSRNQEAIWAYPCASVLYTYYHNLWGQSPYFGFQTGLTFTQTGYSIDQEQTIYNVVQLPVISQFHIDFWRMRLLLNIGGYGGYRINATRVTPNGQGGKERTPVVFDCNHIPWDYGVTGGGGLAFNLHPFELQIECNYQFSFSFLENPERYSSENLRYGYPNQLQFSIGLFYHL